MRACVRACVCVSKWKRPGANFPKKEAGQEVRKNDTYTNKHSLKILNMIMKHSIKSPSLTTFYIMIKYCPILYTGILFTLNTLGNFFQPRTC